MFIAMNRFKIALGQEESFERIWRERETHLEKVPGFKEFRLLKGPRKEDHTLYASHTIWSCEADFSAWTQSEAFRLAHRNAGNTEGLYLSRPQFEGFESVQEVIGHKANA